MDEIEGVDVGHFRLWDALKFAHTLYKPVTYEDIHHVLGETWWDFDQATFMLDCIEKVGWIESRPDEKGMMTVKLTEEGRLLASRIAAIEIELEGLDRALGRVHRESEQILKRLAQTVAEAGIELPFIDEDRPAGLREALGE